MSQSLTATQILDYSLCQIAAESFLQDEKNPNVVAFKDKDSLKSLLQIGNKHVTAMTAVDADYFTKNYSIVEQHDPSVGWDNSNEVANSGYSGTLIQSIEDPTRYILSNRSTEFLDDSLRDSIATNQAQIKNHGIALSQITEMVQWIEKMVKSNAINPGSTLDITGYSLGGHLATCLWLMTTQDTPLKALLDSKNIKIGNAVTFNGAGIGSVNGGQFDTMGTVLYKATQEVSANIEQVAHDPDFWSSKLNLSEDDAQVYRDVKSCISELTPITDYCGLVRQNKDIYVKLKTISASHTVQNSILREALDNLITFAYKAGVVTYLSGDGQHSIDTAVQSNNFNGISEENNPDPVSLTKAIAFGIDHQLSVLYSYETLGIQSNVSYTKDLFRAYFDTNNMHNSSNFYEFSGEASPSFVANSQDHAGVRDFIPIENQPITRGSYVSEVLNKDETTIADVANGYIRNDFGDTHSLMLQVDSLKVLKFLNDHGTSNIDLRTWRDMYSQASQIIAAKNGDQGICEGDVLANILMGIGQVLSLDSTVLAKIKTTILNTTGGTWGNSNRRAAIDEILSAIDLKLNGSSINLNSTFEAIASPKGTLDKYRLFCPTIADMTSSFYVFKSVIVCSPFCIKESKPIKVGLLSGNDAELYKLWSSLKDIPVSRDSAGNQQYIVNEGYGYFNNLLTIYKDKLQINIGNIQDPAATSTSNADGFQNISTIATNKKVVSIFNTMNNNPDSNAAPLDKNGFQTTEKLTFGNADVVDIAIGNLYKATNLKYGQGGAAAGGSTIIGGLKNDKLVGSGSGDKLYGLNGDDTLDAGYSASSKKLEYLYGGLGKDTYILYTKGGSAIINDSDNNGVIYFKAGSGTDDNVQDILRTCVFDAATNSYTGSFDDGSKIQFQYLISKDSNPAGLQETNKNLIKITSQKDDSSPVTVGYIAVDSKKIDWGNTFDLLGIQFNTKSTDLEGIANAGIAAARNLPSYTGELSPDSPEYIALAKKQYAMLQLIFCCDGVDPWAIYLQSFNPDLPFNPVFWCDPVVLDLNGDGVISTGSLNNTHAYFDADGEGFGEKTSWLKGGVDGILVRDLNENGTIDNGGELFGDKTASVIPWIRFTNGMQALAELDNTRLAGGNMDGVLDANDVAFSELKIWKDLNGNGLVEDGEVTTLAENGITSINIKDAQWIGSLDENGNKIGHSSTYTDANGVSKLVQDISFRTDPINLAVGQNLAKYLSYLEQYNLEFKSYFDNGVKNITGIGALLDLKLVTAWSMMNQYQFNNRYDRDLGNLNEISINGSSSDLMTVLCQLDKSISDYIVGDATQQAGDLNALLENTKKLVKSVFELWVLASSEFKKLNLNMNNSDPAVNSEGYLVLSGIYGKDIGSAIDNGIGSTGAAESILNDTLDTLVSRVLSQTIASKLLPTDIYRLFDSLKYTTYSIDNDTDTLVESIPGSSFTNEFVDKLVVTLNNANSNSASVRESWFRTLEVLEKIHENVAVDSALKDYVITKFMTNVDCTTALVGQGYGTEGVLKAISSALNGEGNVIFEESLKLGAENTDVINTSDLAGSLNDYIIGGEGADLIMTAPSAYQLTQPNNLKTLAIYGGGGNDRVYGGIEYDYMYGGTGDDMLGSDSSQQTGFFDASDYGYQFGLRTTFAGITGNYYEGDEGNDVCYGTISSDTYFFRQGDGQDTIIEAAPVKSTANKQAYTAILNATDIIEFDQSVAYSSISYSRFGFDLLFKNSSNTDTILVKDWYRDNSRQIEFVNFLDSNKNIVHQWSKADINSSTVNSPCVLTGTDLNDNITGDSSVSNLISGLDGDDIITGGSYNDTLEGGNGNDSLSGKGGFNTYYGGDGDDTIADNSSTGADITAGTGNDTVNITNCSGTVTINYSKGDGFDTINEGTSFPLVVQFDSSIAKSDLILQQVVVNHTVIPLLTFNNYDGGMSLKGLMQYNSTIGSYFISPNLTISFKDSAGNISYWSNTDLNNLLGLSKVSSGDDVLHGVSDIQNKIDGLAGNDTIYGGSLSDELIGGEGDDYLDGGSGQDILIGGQGNDTYVVDNFNDKVQENQNEGSDTVEALTSYQMADNVENGVLASAVNGDYLKAGATGVSLRFSQGDSHVNQSLIGGSGDDILCGIQGANNLKGGNGVDTYYASNGNTIYDVDNKGSIYFEQTQLSNSTLGIFTWNSATACFINDSYILKLSNPLVTDSQAVLGYFQIIQKNTGSCINIQVLQNDALSVYYSLLKNHKTGSDLSSVNVLGLIFKDETSLTGTEGNDILKCDGKAGLIYGLGGADTITGSGFNEIIEGGSGNDTIDGGGGTDVFIGGLNNDTLIVDSMDDRVIEKSTDIGTDTVIVKSEGGYTFASESEGIEIVDFRSTSQNSKVDLSAITIATGTQTMSIYDNTVSAIANTIIGSGRNDNITVTEHSANQIIDGQGGTNTLIIKAESVSTASLVIDQSGFNYIKSDGSQGYTNISNIANLNLMQNNLVLSSNSTSMKFASIVLFGGNSVTSMDTLKYNIFLKGANSSSIISNLDGNLYYQGSGANKLVLSQQSSNIGYVISSGSSLDITVSGKIYNFQDLTGTNQAISRLDGSLISLKDIDQGVVTYRLDTVDSYRDRYLFTNTATGSKMIINVAKNTKSAGLFTFGTNNSLPTYGLTDVLNLIDKSHLKTIIGTASVDSLRGNTQSNQIWTNGGNDNVLTQYGVDSVHIRSGSNSTVLCNTDTLLSVDSAVASLIGSNHHYTIGFVSNMSANYDPFIKLGTTSSNYNAYGLSLVADDGTTINVFKQAGSNSKIALANLDISKAIDTYTGLVTTGADTSVITDYISSLSGSLSIEAFSPDTSTTVSAMNMGSLYNVLTQQALSASVDVYSSTQSAINQQSLAFSTSSVNSSVADKLVVQ